jgi:hypothetical protein
VWNKHVALKGTLMPL